MTRRVQPIESLSMCESCGHGSATPPEVPDPSRRSFVMMGLMALPLMPAVLSGCATQTAGRALPGPFWKPRASAESMTTQPGPALGPTTNAPFPGVIARSRWTSAAPHMPNIKPMTSIHSITVHHDGMSPYFDAHELATRSRLETIRRSHRDQQKWADIGYHFAVDRSGRVFECRSLAYQGAHVKDHNEGNIGVLALGNFEQQSPTEAQLVGLQEHLTRLMHTYRISPTRVRTHREWPGARTACPGRALQQYMDHIRSRRILG